MANNETLHWLVRQKIRGSIEADRQARGAQRNAGM
jgi:hypothetical protein